MKSSNQLLSWLTGRNGLSLLATATIMATTTSSKAADFYWDNGAAEATPLWATLANWDTLADGTGGDPLAVPGTSDTVYFNTSILNAPQVASVATALPLTGLVFNNTGTTIINTTASTAITLGAGGMNVASGAGLVTFGTSTSPNRITFALSAPQSWTNNSANTLSILRTINLHANTLTIDGSGNISVTGAISGAGGAVVKQGAGTLSFTATETFSGGLTIKAGMVTSSQTALGTIFGTGTIILGDGGSGGGNATLQSSGQNLGIANNITVASSSTGTLTIQGITAAANVFSGTIALDHALTVDNNVGASKSTTFSGVITGSATLTKGPGVGIVALTGANGATFTGNTVINGGTLNFADGSLGNGSGSITFGGNSTLQWAAGNTQDISSHPLSSNGFTATLDVGANNVTLATANGLTGTGNFTKYFSGTAPGTLTLSAENDVTGTYTGSTSGGSTILANANALKNATIAPSNVSGTTYGIVFDSSVTANGNRFTIGGLTGSGKVVLQNNAASPVALQVGNNNTTSSSNGGISGSGSLEKIGNGTWTYNSSASHTGDTTISAGTLALGLSGVIGNSANVSVAGGAILDVSTPPSFTIGAGRALRGTGTVIGATTVNGVVAPGGGGIGHLNINGTVTWNGAVTNPWQFELGAGTADKLHLTGDFAKGTGVDGTDFVFDFAGSTSTGTFTLVDWTGSSTFVDASFSYVNLGGGNTATFAIVAGTPNQLQVTVSGGGGSPYDTWATTNSLTGLPGSSTDPAKDADPDKDGRNNLAEFAFNGNPTSGSDNGKVYMLKEDSDFDGDAIQELILTVAVRTGTPVFAGSPSPSAIQASDGITYTIEGSLDLASFPTTVNVVSPVITGLPADPGAGYEYRSFSLNGSNGLTGKGFLRAKVTSP